MPFKQNYEEVVQRQLVIGNVHARIGIPSWLIMRGIREIEKSFLCKLLEPSKIFML